jgi:hypothetical protein
VIGYEPILLRYYHVVHCDNVQKRFPPDFQCRFDATKIYKNSKVDITHLSLLSIFIHKRSDSMNTKLLDSWPSVGGELDLAYVCFESLNIHNEDIRNTRMIDRWDEYNGVAYDKFCHRPIS